MIRVPLLLTACAVSLCWPIAAEGQELKGQLKIGVHKLDLAAGKLYEIIFAGPPNTQLMVETRQGMITYSYPADFNLPPSRYFMPPKSGDFTFFVTPPNSARPESGVIDYTIHFKARDFEEKPLLTAKDKLTDTDPLYKQGMKYFKSYKVQLKASQLYVIDLVKDGVRDPYLFLENAKGQVVMSDDDGGGDLNSRIIFSPPQDGEFTIIATTLGKETGGFDLTVRSAK